MPQTWTAEDLTQPRRRWPRVAAIGGVLAVAVGLAAVLFVVTAPPRAVPAPRGTGTFGAVTSVDLLPGYDVDEEHAELGPARLVLTGDRPVFLPADTPYSGAAPCDALRPPEDAPGQPCHLVVWTGEDGRTATWVTVLRPGGPGEVLLNGRLLSTSDQRLVLEDGTALPVGASLRVAECGSEDPAAVVGRQVVVSIDETTGTARQVTCRA